MPVQLYGRASAQRHLLPRMSRLILLLFALFLSVRLTKAEPGAASDGDYTAPGLVGPIGISASEAEYSWGSFPGRPTWPISGATI